MLYRYGSYDDNNYCCFQEDESRTRVGSQGSADGGYGSGIINQWNSQATTNITDEIRRHMD